MTYTNILNINAIQLAFIGICRHYFKKIMERKLGKAAFRHTK